MLAMSRQSGLQQLLVVAVVAILASVAAADNQPARALKIVNAPLPSGYSYCNPSTRCSTNAECGHQQCATTKCWNGKCIVQPYKWGTQACSDNNACTIGDYCDGTYGPKSCKPGKAKDCSIYPPPNLALKSCYDKPICNPYNGTCEWTFKEPALQAAQSAASACGTWAGAFATALESTGVTPSPYGSVAWSECEAKCKADICVSQLVPECSCMTTAYSTSIATAGNCQPCPMALMMMDPTLCDTIKCNNGQYSYDDGSKCDAFCWYPNKDVKSGKGGVLYPCPGKKYTSYKLTGGTSISMCAGCVSLGAAYDKKSTRCYGGNVTVPPVDP